MWFRGLLFDSSAFFLMLCTLLVGGVFIAAALCDVVLKRLANANWTMPTALFPFTIAVMMDPIGYILRGWNYPEGRMGNLVLAIMLLAFAGSFALLLYSRSLSRRDSGPGMRILKIGTNTLIVVALFGFLGIIAGLAEIVSRPT
jgi:hypothetical protein